MVLVHNTVHIHPLGIYTSGAVKAENYAPALQNLRPRNPGLALPPGVRLLRLRARCGALLPLHLPPGIRLLLAGTRFRRHG
jgi:hypothetical protein